MKATKAVLGARKKKGKRTAKNKDYKAISDLLKAKNIKEVIIKDEELAEAKRDLHKYI